MTKPEIDQLIAEMIVEDLRQEHITEEESPHLLEELLRAHEYERHWKLNSPIESQSYHELAQAYAASLPADDFVNDPAYPAEFRNAAGSAIIAGWSAI